jgi:hypothetical protein
MQVSFEQLESGRWDKALSPEAQDDLREFSSVMAKRYFDALSSACRKVDPHHLNLGARYNMVPPAWVVAAMTSFDVFSMNRYAERVPHADFATIHATLKLPIIVGEFGFGALDVGLPGTGPAPRLRNQADRGREYRLFVEDAAADPNCVGAHWFQMYDQPAIGRPDGECYNLGMVDVCNCVYEEMERAVIAAHERVFQVAAGIEAPFGDAPEYLPIVSM